jgi:hypothetical protein
VNERASINASFVEQNTRALRRDNTRVLGTEVNDARLGLGASFGLTNHLSLVVNAGMGLTDQSPGYTLSFSLPITLPLKH